MKKLLSFYRENEKDIDVAYKTFKKYIFDNIDKFEDCIKIVNNVQRKSYYITDEEQFLRIFKS